MFNQTFTVAGSSLRLLKPGERGVVTRLKATNDVAAQKLRAIGITPGTSITVEQRFPRFVVRIGGNRLTLSETVINAVYVRISSPQVSGNRRMTMTAVN
ncbi:FeoA family protein [Pantanalinema sp. GBBB05]|uniref:FeoA family protein n=1 Tax=Pantanalinema sp. GBBB05 TaxID=2604139 RepID=UPI001D2E2F1B|nr:ferrous iron transport protein A [Pantanalinema sp. GBBB05]